MNVQGSDYNRLLAEMVVRSRQPNIPTGGGGARMIGGGAVKAKETNVQASVDLGSIERFAKFFGYKTEAERKALGDQFMNFSNQVDDAEYEKLITDPKSQEMLGGAYGLVPGVIKDETGRYGLARNLLRQQPANKRGEVALYGGPKAGDIEQQRVAGNEARQTTELEAKVKPSEVQVKSGLAGEQPRQTYVQSANEIALATETPTQRALSQSQAKYYDMLTQAKQAEMEYYPKEFGLKKQELQGKLALWDSEIEKNVAYAANLAVQNSTGLTKEQQDNLEKLDGSFFAALKPFREARLTMLRADPTVRFTTMKSLEGDVALYISGVRQVTKGYAADRALAGVSVFIDYAAQEFMEAPKQAGTIASWMGGDKAIQQDLMRRKYYAETSFNFLKQMKDWYPDLAKKVYKMNKEVGANPDFVKHCETMYPDWAAGR